MRPKLPLLLAVGEEVQVAREVPAERRDPGAAPLAVLQHARSAGQLQGQPAVRRFRQDPVCLLQQRQDGGWRALTQSGSP